MPFKAKLLEVLLNLKRFQKVNLESEKVRLVCAAGKPTPLVHVQVHVQDRHLRPLAEGGVFL
jgi:hypothetical protein